MTLRSSLLHHQRREKLCKILVDKVTDKVHGTPSHLNSLVIDGIQAIAEDDATQTTILVLGTKRKYTVNYGVGDRPQGIATSQDSKKVLVGSKTLRVRTKVEKRQPDWI